MKLKKNHKRVSQSLAEIGIDSMKTNLIYIMNYIKYILALVSIFAVLASAGQSISIFVPTVRIADNNFNAPQGDNIYATIQEAVDASEPGDIVYIQPSPTSYGSVTLEKEVHLVGIGFNLDKDAPHISQTVDVVFQNNVDNTSNPSNSTVTGLKIRDIYVIKQSGTANYTLESVEITNCEIREIQNACCNSYMPMNNLELSGNSFSQEVQLVNQATNVLIRNNLFQSGVYFLSTNPNSGVVSNNIFYAPLSKYSQGDNLIVQNNNFIGVTGSSRAFITTMIDVIIANNIFYGRTPSIEVAGGSSSTQFQRNTFTNNISFSTGDDSLPPAGGGAGNTGDGNIEGSSPLFTDVPLLNTWSSDYDFTLTGGSPAEGGGSDGSDIGITGGPYPLTSPNFFLKTTPLPTIQTFNTSTIINPDDDLDIRVKVKAN